MKKNPTSHFTGLPLVMGLFAQSIRHISNAIGYCLLVVLATSCSDINQNRHKHIDGVRLGQNITVDVGHEKKIAMIWVKPGTFMMGTPSDEEGRGKDEKQHRVTLTEGFWLGKYEVTQGDWKALMGNQPSRFKHAGLDAPVECVSWSDCVKFCQKLTEQERQAGRLPAGYKYGLPTEAQWEYACRAGSTTAIYTGSLQILGEMNAPKLDEIAWYGGNSGVRYHNGGDSSKWKEMQYPQDRSGTHPVGMKKPNKWGFHDMIGNAWEWCSDWYGEYPSDSVTDPVGPSTGQKRVQRVGSWLDFAMFCRSGNRVGIKPETRFNRIGFRLALIPQ